MCAPLPAGGWGGTLPPCPRPLSPGKPPPAAHPPPSSPSELPGCSSSITAGIRDPRQVALLRQPWAPHHHIALPKFRDSFPEWPQWVPGAGPWSCAWWCCRSRRQQRGGRAPSAEFSFSFPLLKKYALICLSYQLIFQLKLPSIPTLQDNKPYKSNGYPVA